MRVRSAVLAAVAAAFLLAAPAADAAGVTVQMLDRLGAAAGTAKVTLATGAVTLKATLAALPATVETGAAPFEAWHYRAYLASSTDPAVELSLGAVYPAASGKFQVKAAFKGDLGRMGFDRVLVVAYSKDGLTSFDVLTGTLPPL